MSITPKRAVDGVARTLAAACASLALTAGAYAQAHGGHVGGAHYVHGGGYGGYHGGGYGGYRGGGYYAPRYGYRRGGPGWIWGGVGLGVGLGLASYYSTYPYGYADPGYVVVDPPVVYDNPQPVYSQPVPVRSSQPVIYPRSGQSAGQTDADANACSEWAGRQPNASGDRSVFQRGIAACMDARGYTVR